MSRRALDMMAGAPYPDGGRRGLDFRLTMKLRRIGVQQADVVLTPDCGTLVDIKTDTNIWSYGHIAKYEGRQPAVVTSRDYEDIVSRFPERDMIDELGGGNLLAAVARWNPKEGDAECRAVVAQLVQRVASL